MDINLLDQEQRVAAFGGALVGLTLYSIFAYELYRSVLRRVISAVVGGVLGVAGLAVSQRFAWTFPGWDWVIVALLGAGVAVGELVSRYQDAPARTLRTTPALFYVLLNSGAAAAALMLIEALGWQVQPPGDTPTSPVHWPQVFTAGLGAMAILRSAIFTVRVGSQDVAVGPTTFLQAIFEATDSALDRLRAEDRATAAARLMTSVRYDRA